MLLEQILLDEDFLEEGRARGWAEDAEEWWSDTEEYTTAEVRNATGRKKVTSGPQRGEGLPMEECLTEEPDANLTNAIIDGLVSDMRDGKERDLSNVEQVQAFESFSKRQRSVSSPQQFALIFVVTYS
jgi:hypothetical protein